MDSQNFLKKTLLAGLGIFSLSREKAQELIEDLVQRGELSKGEGSKFVKAMMTKAEEEVAFLKQLIDDRVNRTLAKLGTSDKDEIKRLEAKIEKLTKEVEKLSKSKRAS